MSLVRKLDPERKTLTIAVSGKFDFAVHPEFRAAYKDVDRSFAVILDLKGTEYMDSAALGMLLLLRDEFPSQSPVIKNCSEFVRQILHVARFEKRFTIE
jgi:anti-anti-sigma factor